jgi:arylsulfotransferase ASST
MKPFLVLTLLILLTGGCSDANDPSTNEGDGGSDADSDSDADGDSDGDSDGDTDSDTDADADADADTDADADADSDTDADTDSIDTDYNPDNDYVLYNPNGTRTTYLVDMDGNTVHSWENGNNGGYSVYLLDNGNILRPGQASNTQLKGGASAGLLEEIDWNGNVVWEFEYNSADYLAHHDIEPMPNGNALMIAWEVKSAAEAKAAGRESSSEIWPDHIIEVEPTGSQGGDIVWEWHAWDHLVQDHDSSKDNYGVVADHPELFDVNLGEIKAGPGPSGGSDWLHINGVSYNPDKDQIVISSHFMDEFYIIDHSTTTAEAAGHTGGNSGKGGDILYRWGSPENYGAPGDKAFYVIHCSR